MNKIVNSILTAIAGIIIVFFFYLSFTDNSPILGGIGLIMSFFLYNKFFKKDVTPEVDACVKSTMKIASLVTAIPFFIISSLFFIFLGSLEAHQEELIFFYVVTSFAGAPMILIGTVLFCNVMNKNIGFKIFSWILLIDFIFIEILLLPSCLSFINNNLGVNWFLCLAAVATLTSMIILVSKMIKINQGIKIKD